MPAPPGYMRTARPARGRVCGSPRPAVRIGAGNDPCPGYLRRRDRSHGQVAQYLLAGLTLSYNQIDGIFGPVTNAPAPPPPCRPGPLTTRRKPR